MEPGGDGASDRLPSAAFYCVSDAGHFPGVVALLNSLRLAGHDEPFVLVDCGLEPEQRDLIAPHARFVPAPPNVPPMLLKAAGPLAYPAEVMVVLDADVIVTRPLTGPMELAAAGKVVAFANDDPTRFFAEWGDLLGLGPPRRQPYVASGHLFVPDGSFGRRFLELFDDAQARIDAGKTLLANEPLLVRSTPNDPFYYPDMDVLNAVLASGVASGRFVALDYRLAPHAPFPGLRLVDERALVCRYEDGTQPLVLHHVLRKPWLAPTRRNAYSLLLTRLLLGPDVTVRMDPSDLPLRLREGVPAALDRLRADVQAELHHRLRGKLGIRPRLAARRAGRG